MGECEFRWSKKREQAALLVAEDELSDVEIAARCGIGKRTLEYWKKRPEFAARVEEHKAVSAGIQIGVSLHAGVSAQCYGIGGCIGGVLLVSLAVVQQGLEITGGVRWQ